MRASLIAVTLFLGLNAAPSGCTDFRRIYDPVRPISSNGWEKTACTGEGLGDELITDGAVSPDGAWVVLRTRQGLTFHRAADLFAYRR